MSSEDLAFCVVFCTFPDLLIAKKVASALLNRQLVACVNLIPSVSSLYIWEEKIKEDTEVLAIIKTQQSLVKELEVEVKKLHPYEIPEFISCPITYGSQAYLEWIGQVTQKK